MKENFSSFLPSFLHVETRSGGRRRKWMRIEESGREERRGERKEFLRAKEIRET